MKANLGFAATVIFLVMLLPIADKSVALTLKLGEIPDRLTVQAPIKKQNSACFTAGDNISPGNS